MKNLWSRVIGSGVTAGLPPRTVRFVQNLNGISVMIGLWLISITGFWVPYLPATRNILLAGLIVGAGLMLIPLVQKARAYLLARVLFLLLGYSIITANAFQLGHDTWNHLFLLASILIGFYVYEKLWELILTTVIGLSLFTGIETLHLMGVPSPLKGKVPDRFFELALYIDVYNIIFLTIALAFYNRGVLRKVERAFDREKEISESLLLNILPAEIAERLKVKPEGIADHVPVASVLFADLVGFTALSRNMPAEKLVAMLNEVFIHFDRLAKKLGLEKIKTIGDAYMVAAGIPKARPDHAQACVEMGREMLRHLDAMRMKYSELSVRIGIHSGPLVAGVIGESKFAYDLWGDTVNTASRMESHGIPGRVHVSDETKQFLDGLVELESRGEIEVKGKGRMRTWLVHV